MLSSAVDVAVRSREPSTLIVEPGTGMLLEPLLDRPASFVESAEVDQTGGAEPELPRGRLEPLGFGAHGQHRRPTLRGVCDAMLVRLEEDERPGRCIELLLVRAESRAAGDDDVQLLVRVRVLL